MRQKLLRTAATLLLASAGVAMPVHAQINAEQMVAIGRNVMSMEDFMLAIQYFNQAIKAKPYLAEPYYLRAVAKLNLEDFKGAEDDATESIARNKYTTDAYKLRGYCRQNLGLDSLAIADYDIGLRYNPDDRYMLFYKAAALGTLERYDEADSILNRVLEDNPRFEDALTMRARTRVMRGDTIGALDDIDRSVEISKANINNYLMRADIHIKQKDWRAAAADMDEVIRLDPQNPDMYVNRAWLRYNIDSYAGALADYNYALELNPDNIPATYNRALLRLEYMDYPGAFADFSTVLRHDPQNFHALYNRALIALNLKRWKQAITDFTTISKRYPRFYPLYYGIAQAKEGMGDHDGAIRAMLYAEDIVRKYVDNPRKNPLSRPAIEVGLTNDRGMEQSEGETDTDVMERFNRLVTVSETTDTELKYEDRIKGRVQDRKQRVEPEPMFTLSFADGRTSLRPNANYFIEIDDINRRRLLSRTLYVTNHRESLSREQAEELFALLDDYTSVIAAGNPRPIDLFGRAVVQFMLMNHRQALDDLDKAIEADPQFTSAYLLRANVRDAILQHPAEGSLPPTPVEIMSDLDHALELNPRLIYAWYDKGNVYYAAGDYLSALPCFNRAIELGPDFAEAFFNRGLTLLALGRRDEAFADLSRAGQLGIHNAYSVLKAMR